MKIIGTIILMIFSLTCLGQTVTYSSNWLNVCDSSFTQAELNACTYREFKKADSLMTTLYCEIINHIDNTISEEKQFESPDKDHSDWLIKRKTAIITSQEQWLKLRDANSEILNVEYKGGSMRSMAVNISATNDTYIRLEKLKEIRNLLMNGS